VKDPGNQRLGAGARPTLRNHWPRRPPTVLCCITILRYRKF